MIYFIEAVGIDRVKIGTSINPEQRLLKLTHYMPCDVRLMKVVEGGYREEHALHHRFRDHRVKGEWFVLSAIREEIDSIEGTLEHIVKAMETCIDCGVVRRNSRYGERCKVCAGKARRAAPHPTKAAPTCIACGVGISAKSMVKQGTKYSGMCRPCGMKVAWADPVYRATVIEARAKARARRAGLTGSRGG